MEVWQVSATRSLPAVRCVGRSGFHRNARLWRERPDPDLCPVGYHVHLVGRSVRVLDSALDNCGHHGCLFHHGAAHGDPYDNQAATGDCPNSARPNDEYEYNDEHEHEHDDDRVASPCWEDRFRIFRRRKGLLVPTDRATGAGGHQGRSWRHRGGRSGWPAGTTTSGSLTYCSFPFSADLPDSAA